MITASKRIHGTSGDSLRYMLGGDAKDQKVRVVAYNGFELSRKMVAEIETIPDRNGIVAHKKAVNKIANNLAKVFDARAKLADDRVKDAFQRYIISFVSKERERLRQVPSKDELFGFGMRENETRTLERIISDELLERIGVHGEIEVTLRRKGEDGKKTNVKKTVHREAMYLAVAHDGTAHPHLHILAARTDANGKCNDTRNEYRRIKKAIDDIARRYKLEMKLDEGYEPDRKKVNEGYAAKLDLRDKVKEVLSKATGEKDLKDMLQAGGINMTLKAHSGNGKSYGVVFTIRDKKGKLHHYSGSQLDRGLTYARIVKRLAANKARVEKARQNDYKLVAPFIKDLAAIKNNAYLLYEETKKSHIQICSETTDIYVNLKKNWSEFKQLTDECKGAEADAITTATIGGMLMLLNPLLGLVALFLGMITDDIRRAQQSEHKMLLLSHIETERTKIKALEEQKARLKAEKSSRLQGYLNAKNMYNDYRDGLKRTDDNIAAIKKDLEKRKVIQSYIDSDEAKELLSRINNAFNPFSSYYHLVPGRLLNTASGLRWELYTDGHTDGNDLFNQRDPAPQDYGKSYVDFTFNERGEVIAAVECDNTNYYSKGVSGLFNLHTGKGELRQRQYAGSKEMHDAEPMQTALPKKKQDKKGVRPKYPNL